MPSYGEKIGRSEYCNGAFMFEFLQDKWTDLIPEHEKDVLEYVNCVHKDKLIVEYLSDVKVRDYSVFVHYFSWDDCMRQLNDYEQLKGLSSSLPERVLLRSQIGSYFEVKML